MTGSIGIWLAVRAVYSGLWRLVAALLHVLLVNPSESHLYNKAQLLPFSPTANMVLQL